MSRFVRPLTDTLTLADGDTLTVRRRLNTGEQRAAFQRCSTAVENEETGATELKVNPLLVGIAKVAAYLIDWTVRDDEGEVVPVAGLSPDDVIAVLDNLDPDDFLEIKEAVDRHEVKQAALRMKEKNDRAGVTPAPATLPSLSVAAGASSGSAS